MKGTKGRAAGRRKQETARGGKASGQKGKELQEAPPAVITALSDPQDGSYAVKGNCSPPQQLCLPLATSQQQLALTLGLRAEGSLPPSPYSGLLGLLR